METLLSDIRYGLRGLLGAPGFTITALIALALGIGANTAIFSVVNPILFQPLPLPEPDELVAVIPYQMKSGEEIGNVSHPDFLDWQDQAQSFEAMGELSELSVVLDTPGQPIRGKSFLVSPGLLAAIGVPVALGRTLVDADDTAASAPVAVLAHDAFVRYFGGQADVVGRSVAIDGKPYTIVGVMSGAFHLPVARSEPDVFIPLHAHPYSASMLESRGNHFLRVFARLEDGVSIAAATAEMNTVSRRLAGAYADPGHVDVGIKLVDLGERATADIRPAAVILLFAVGLVLLIACGNVANLLLARASVRQREMAVRLALGASRGRLVRQLLTESVLLSVLGALLGLLLSMWMADGLAVYMGSNLRHSGIDGSVLVFTGLVALITGIVFGLVPALSGSRLDIHDILQESGLRASPGQRRMRAQSLLIAAQIALAFALLSSAALMIESLVNLTRVDPGFRAHDLVTMRVPLPDFGYTLDQKREFYRQLIERTGDLPGVTGAAGGDPFPFRGGTSKTTVHVEGMAPLPPGESIDPNMYEVSAGYFATMGIPILAGRTFSAAEQTAAENRAIIINQRFARRFWPDESALGHRIEIGSGQPLEIVGVVGDVRHGTLDSDPPLQFYVPYEFSRWMSLALVVRAQGAPEALFPALRGLLRELDPGLPVNDPRLVSDVLAETTQNRRVTMFLLGAFALLALVLATVGIYGVIAYNVSQRGRELAIRMALGATQKDIVRLVVKRGLRMTAVGLALGIGLSLFAARLLGSLLYGVAGADPLMYAAIAVILGLAAITACLAPAFAATRVSPVSVLRAE